MLLPASSALLIGTLFIVRCNSAKRENITVEQQDLEVAPPFPFLEVGLQYILSQIGQNATKAHNDSIQQFASHLSPNITSSNQSQAVVVPQPLAKPAGPTQCSITLPCLDGSCCNSEGNCGFTPYHCNTTATTRCVRDCNARAMCGVDSLYSQQKCPLNICCSYFGYCGTTSVHCSNSGKTPCQKGYGQCEVVAPPLCPGGSTATKGRRIAYYQVSNVYGRRCNRIVPSQINTKGLTHLNLAFASIDPKTFHVIPTDSLDLTLYLEFSNLKTRKLQTWIAIGGFDFNNPGPTHTTFSDMVAMPANRATFIKSLIEFMNAWEFQGADLDWEYPAQPSRGGHPNDAANLVALVKEMRSAFGDKYGLSLALPPDFGYLSGYDPVGMAPFVDFFNYMTYDLHGPWEASYLGAFVRPHTSINDIDSYMLPMWFDGVPSYQINIGIAYYGRGFTLSDRNCREIGCPYTGGNKAGPCTASTGLLSLQEINQLVMNKVALTNLLPDLMIKQISWDDQWIGYDDDETIALKIKWADLHCLAGTAVWSADLNSGAGSGDSPMTLSTDGTCGKGVMCLGSMFGDCCSKNGWCGSTKEYCSPSSGCQLEYGTCVLETAAGAHVSTDGRCGNGATCTGSAFGKCCSSAGYCGSSPLYCSPGGGCQSSYGICIGGGAGTISTNGMCGNGITCQNSGFGNCCSQYGYCGTTSDHCAGTNGCRPQFGTCQ